MSELHLQPEAAAEMAANAVLVYQKQCGLRSKKAKDEWVEKVFELVRNKQ